MITGLNRTVQLLLTNSSGSALLHGDVVVLDSAQDRSVTVTGLLRQTVRSPGVVLEPNGIPAGRAGMIAVSGWVPKINLLAAASPGWKIGTSAIWGRGTADSVTPVAGDFGEALSSGSAPEAYLWGRPIVAA